MNYQNVLAPTKTEHDRVKNLEMVSIVTLGSNSGVLTQPKETFCSKSVLNTTVDVQATENGQDQKMGKSSI